MNRYSCIMGSSHIKDNKDRRYRHEHKYLCSDGEAYVLYHRLSAIMEKDNHVTSDGGYLIRSLYFDDYLDSGMFDNEEGASFKDKWRIRIYDLDNSYISLENKSKHGDMTLKSSCRISVDEYDMILKGLMSPYTDRVLLNRFISLQQSVMLTPKVIVGYRRFPYVCESGNVRVTFDCDISSSADIDGFFDPMITSRPILPMGFQLLEVKYDELIPDHIFHALHLRDLNRISFSKYYLCRHFQ